MKKKRKQNKKKKAVEFMKPSMTWEIVKLPNGSYQWIAKVRG